MPRILVPLPDLQLDPRNTEALLNSMQTTIYLESNGALNDFTASSPLSALTEGQAFAQSELLYYLNALPEAFVLQWLKLMGIQRIIGSHSFADMIFFRQAGFSQTVVIPEGSEFFTSAGLKFILLSSIELTTSEPVVGHVRSEKWGTVYNVPAGSIVRSPVPIRGLGTFYNPQPASGGLGEESVGEMKSRALTALSRRSLTTREDYLFEIQSIFPDLDSIGVYTFEELSPFIDGLAPNYIYVCFCQQSQIVFTSEYISAEVLKALRLKSPLTTNISIIEPIYNRLRIDMTLEFNSVSVPNSDTTSAQIYQSLLEAFSFSNKPLGSDVSIDEIIRLVQGFGITPSIISVGALKLFLDTDEPTFEQGCSDEYSTIIDEDGFCSPDYLWILDSSLTDTYSPGPTEVYTIYEVNISMLNTDTITTVTYTFKNAQ
jgi:hypothetical protein